VLSVQAPYQPPAVAEILVKDLYRAKPVAHSVSWSPLPRHPAARADTAWSGHQLADVPACASPRPAGHRRATAAEAPSREGPAVPRPTPYAARPAQFTAWRTVTFEGAYALGVELKCADGSSFWLRVTAGGGQDRDPEEDPHRDYVIPTDAIA